MHPARPRGSQPRLRRRGPGPGSSGAVIKQQNGLAGDVRARPKCSVIHSLMKPGGNGRRRRLPQLHSVDHKCNGVTVYTKGTPKVRCTMDGVRVVPCTNA
jgi:hypothetical protein